MRKKTTVSIRALAFKRNAIRLRLSSKSFNKILQKNPKNIPKNKFKQGWRNIAERRIYFRSRWEANLGFYMQWQKQRKMIIDWEHEPKTFWFEGIKRGCVSYLPDFKIINLDGSHYWVEVKGFMDSKSKTKIRRFKKYFPQEHLRVLDSKWYTANSKKLKNIVPGWEKD